MLLYMYKRLVDLFIILLPKLVHASENVRIWLSYITLGISQNK